MLQNEVQKPISLWLINAPGAQFRRALISKPCSLLPPTSLDVAFLAGSDASGEISDLFSASGGEKVLF